MEHLEVLVEEPSMEALLRSLLPRLLGKSANFNIHPFQGKSDLLKKLSGRLRGYRNWLPENWRIMVIVDRDDDDCVELKNRLEEIAKRAGFKTKTFLGTDDWQVVNRLAVEEMEAWFFGDMDAVRTVYPRVSSTLEKKAGYRDPDAIRGGTWEKFERVLQRSGYFESGLRKIEAARAIGAHLDPACNRSRSFQVFRDVISGLTKE